MKQSETHKVDIIIRNLDTALKILVENNGHGFDIDKQSPNSLGLGIMHERAEWLDHHWR